MSQHAAYCFYKVFEPEPAKVIRFDRHYLLYAAKGSMRLETAEKTWVLPPSRAAWLTADTPIAMSFSALITCCSVLYRPGSIAAPKHPCAVFEMTPLAREMLLACQAWGPEAERHEPLAAQMFAALATLTQKLADQPCNTWIPTGQSAGMKRALAFTAAHLAAEVSLEDVAASAHVSKRTLARRFSGETGLTWRQLQRKMRMIRAMELLAEGARVTDVALAVGYGSQSAFNAAFRAFAGESPNTFLRRGE